VLTASGHLVAISKLRKGDKVLATNTKSGKTSPEPVAAVLVRHDSDLYDLRVATAHGTAVIDTTRSHLFFDAGHHRWVKAAALKYGTRLRTPSGATATTRGGHNPKITTGWMWDLNIPGGNDHDFYVAPAGADGLRAHHAGSFAMLVHNSNCISSADILNDPKTLKGLTPGQIDDLARNAGYDVQPGSASAANPATRYYLPGTKNSVGFRVLPSGVAGQSGIKAGAYLRFFGGKLAGIRVPLRLP
jgi:hypothetical protein